MSTSTLRPGYVAVIGAGPIGVAWSVAFARAGEHVRLYDIDPDIQRRSRSNIMDRLERLDSHGILDDPVSVVANRIIATGDLAGAASGARYVQECVAERLDVKRELLLELHDHLPREAVVASSSSVITTSELAADIPGRERCLVAHPANPPYLLPVVEVVPAPFTSEAALTRTTDTLLAIGMRPVVLRREIDGFVMNRLQGALLREAYCLVRDGVVSVDDLDAIVRDGLGRRWAFSGPFETADLNTRGGIRAHAERLGPSYARMGAERGQHDPWTPDLVDRVTSERRTILPLEQWEARNAWREERLMEVAALHAGVPRPTTIPPADRATSDDVRV